MKLVKMSLAAAMVLSTAAMAEITNVKVSGDAKLYYGTTDAKQNILTNAASTTGGFFKKESSYADVAVSLDLTADLSKYISTGVKAIHLTSLGLENELVSQTWSSAHPTNTNTSSFGYETEDITFASEAWLALHAGKTIVKVGRQALDTPLAFTETWSVDANTFGAAVLINQDIENLTLVGAWVGTSNAGAGALNLVGEAHGITNQGSNFNAFGKDGAFAAAAIYGNEKMALTAQYWIYDVMGVADASWLQVDKGLGDLSVGLQYVTKKLKAAGSEQTDAQALKVGYQATKELMVSGAYSAVSDKATAGYNVATGQTTGQSKLYTEAWWSYGMVTQKDNTAMNVTVEYALSDSAKVGLYSTTVDQSATAGDNDLSETTVTVSKDYEGMNATLAYIQAKVGTADTATTIQVLLSASF